MNFDFGRRESYKSLERDKPVQQLLWHAANITDLAGSRSPIDPINVVQTPEWTDANGTVNQLQALKFELEPKEASENTQTQYKLLQRQPGDKDNALSFMWKTSLDDLYIFDAKYDSFIPVTGSQNGIRKLQVLKSLKDFNISEALVRSSESWTIDSKNHYSGLEQVRRTFGHIIAESEELHSKVTKRSLASKILRRPPAVIAEKVPEEFPDDKSAVHFFRDTDKFTK